METGRKTRAWTPEQRAEQARRLRERQIWRRSTGPRTLEGKKISALNAVTHGCRSAPWRRHRLILRMLGVIRRSFMALIKNRQKMTNELRARLAADLGRANTALIMIGDINAILFERVVMRSFTNSPKWKFLDESGLFG